MVIAITGKSGSGKSTLVNNFVKKHKDYHKIIPYTTRPKRPLEQDGVDYHFVSKEDFFKKDTLFLESIYNNGWRYAIDERDIVDISEMDFGDDIIIFADYRKPKKAIGVFTPANVRRLKEKLGSKVISVYINSNDSSNIIRVLQRGDDIKEVIRRYPTELGQFDGYEYESDICIGSSLTEYTPETLLEELETELYKIKDYRDSEWKELQWK